MSTLPRRLEIAARGLDLPTPPSLSARPRRATRSLRYLGTEPRGCVVERMDDRIGDGVLPINSCVCRRRLRRAAILRGDLPACEDWDWWLRLVALGPVAIVCEPGWRHHESPGVRDLHGEPARLEFSHRLLTDHVPFFRDHPRALAYRWKQIGLRELSLGGRASAREAFRNSFAARPSARTAYHYVRSIGPTRSEAAT